MRKELKIRIITALIVAPFVVACFVSYESLVGLVASVVLLASYELLSFSLKGRKRSEIAFFTALSTLHPLLYGLLFKSQPMVSLSIPMMVGTIYCLVKGEEPSIAVESYFGLFTSLLYVSMNLSFFIPIYAMKGPAVALLTLTSVWAFDIFAYFSGLSFGRIRIFSAYTRKTLEGVLGGFFGTLIYISIYKAIAEALGFTTLDWWKVPVFSVIVATMGTFGDVFESSLKRKFGVKDSGVIMPGHGGMLDRIDGLLFTVPVVYTVLIHFGG